MYNGLIIIHKEKGFTSHDVVAKLRGILRQKKIGHTGTLDPDATGVLPVCLGKGTRLTDMLTDRDKTYEAGIRFGLETDTQDISGRVLAQKPAHVTPEALEEAAAAFTGDIMQVPPMYSAIKINGKKLYELARKGREVERSARPVTIHSLEVLALSGDEARIRVRCSKGTYIRTLCHDIGQALGCGACMSSLVRTGVGPFKLEDAHTLGEIEQIMADGPEALLPLVIAPDAVLSDLPAARTMDPAGDKMLRNGARLSPEHLKTDLTGQIGDGQTFRAYTADGTFIGVYGYCAGRNDFKSIKMFS
jgi:tRNA pseudouridine55 synthase